MQFQMGFDTSQAVGYHYGKFPPSELDYSKIASPLAEAAAAIAGYEQMLKGIHNARLFLTPLERQEALSSSRMEGTISTLDELLEYEANLEEADSMPPARMDTLEVHAYRMATGRAEHRIDAGDEPSSELLCSVHSTLLGFTRGQEKSPGKLKTEQNYLVAGGKIVFTPISPVNLEQGLHRLFSFIRDSNVHPLIKTAISHVEFESLHPFNDGNGRVGRILITIMMWKLGLLSRPYFYISGALEKRKDDYTERLRAVSATGDWTSWCVFFLEAVRSQAEMNLAKAEEIRELYDELKETFRSLLSSQWSINALDFVFENPVFRNSSFTNRSGIPKQTANRFTRVLLDAGLISTIRPPSGRRAGLYAFEPLLRLVRM